MNARDVLRSLLELDRPLDEILGELPALTWDSDEELVTLMPAHVISILNGYLAGAFTPMDVERWANAIEGRDDIGFEPKHRDLLGKLIFDLANPVLQGALTQDLAARLVARLRDQTRA